MKDVQSSIDYRQLPINRVGIKGLRLPITVRDRRHGTQRTVATVDMYVELPRHFKGTHMSRFVEVVNEHQGIIDIRQFGHIVRAIKERLDADRAHLIIRFPYFIEKVAPISGARSFMDYNCLYEGEARPDGTVDYLIGVEVPITTLCPCSKEISDRGAHNQRSFARIKVRFAPHKFVWIEDLVRVAEESGSSEVYTLLKRPDEKFVTERAYDNPRFAEDVVREIASRLMQMDEIVWFYVESEHLESIHNHNAYAMIEIDKQK